MRFLTYILLFLFLINIEVKTNFIRFIKKIKTPIELISATELDDKAKELDDDENTERSEKEELKEKDLYSFELNFNSRTSNYYNCNKHILNFCTLLFKSNFKEVVTPPPELV